jgi:hypothetical protein
MKQGGNNSYTTRRLILNIIYTSGTPITLRLNAIISEFFSVAVFLISNISKHIYYVICKYVHSLL